MVTVTNKTKHTNPTMMVLTRSQSPIHNACLRGEAMMVQNQIIVSVLYCRCSSKLLTSGFAAAGLSAKNSLVSDSQYLP